MSKSLVIDIDYLKTWVGNEKTVTDEISKFKVDALSTALSVEDNRHNFLQGANDLPPAWQWLYFLDTPDRSNTGEDGHPKTGGFLPPVPLPRRMWAAGKFSIRKPIKYGSPAERRSIVSNVDLKQGSTGALVFATVNHTISQNGGVCIEEEQNIVYREMPNSPMPLLEGKQAPSDCDWAIEVRPDPVLLFRYSALTYNGHRIHYDRDYAVEREFYPALVVHGPLQATLLANSVRQNHSERQIIDFEFRAQRPLFDTDAFQVCGKSVGNKVKLWTRDKDGFIGMIANATLGDS